MSRRGLSVAYRTLYCCWVVVGTLATTDVGSGVAALAPVGAGIGNQWTGGYPALLAGLAGNCGLAALAMVRNQRWG